MFLYLLSINHKQQRRTVNANNMEATILEVNGKGTKFTTSHRKENKCYFESYTAIVDGVDHKGNPTKKTPVELRLYGTGNKNFACLWVHDSSNSGVSRNGSGSAGGYGYHRPSAAAAEAIRNAGIKLSEDISGRGGQAIESAVKAIAEALGYSNVFVFHAHQ